MITLIAHIGMCEKKVERKKKKIFFFRYSKDQKIQLKNKESPSLFDIRSLGIEQFDQNERMTMSDSYIV